MHRERTRLRLSFESNLIPFGELGMPYEATEALIHAMIVPSCEELGKEGRMKVSWD